MEEKVALITGGASGIGAACALRFAQEGARIAAFDVAKPSDEHRERLAAVAPEVDFHEVDVRDEAAIESAVAAVAERFGRIDVLVNAAGVSGYGGVDTLEADEWDRVVDINLKGTYLVSKHVVRRMLERRSGSVIHLASIEGLEGLNAQAAYNASKGGVVLLTKNMAIDYGPHGIRVNCLCPGFIDTPMTAALKDAALKPVLEQFQRMHILGRIGQPEEVANAALFLASEESSFVTGHSLAVDGGYTAGRSLAIPGA